MVRTDIYPFSLQCGGESSWNRYGLCHLKNPGCGYPVGFKDEIIVEPAKDLRNRRIVDVSCWVGPDLRHLE